MPHGDVLVVRLRIDGILQEVERIPKEHAAGVISRIKVLAKLDIAEHRMPQDGRMSVRAKTSRRLFDIRVAVLPTVEGEGVIMRLLEKTRTAPTLTEIGLSNELQMQLEEVIFRPTGAFLVTGPTGSGKSTTIYAALCDVLRPEINVITIEDPVEYRLPDVYQLQVNKRAGLTFATGLRAILRSDPDVLMVGEIRDLETAKIALEAALTGHAVFSTLHTNDAPSALTRLRELGVEPSITASAISAVLAQRLVRRLCEECREPYESSRADLEYLGFSAAAIEQRRDALPAARLHALRKGLPRPDRRAPADGHERDHQQPPHRRSRAPGARCGGHRGRHDDTLAGRARQGRSRRDNDRRDQPRRPLESSSARAQGVPISFSTCDCSSCGLNGFVR